MLTNTKSNMKCAYPRENRITREKYPCQQCINCRINKRRQWTARLMLELTCHKETQWVTLTYDNQELPRNECGLPELCKKDLQDYFKRLRKEGLTFRYYAVGEYGTRTARPHYHVAFFGMSWTAERILQSQWPHGHIRMEMEVNQKLLQYLCHYTVKKWTKKDDPRLEEREPEFALSSRRPGIGVPAVERLCSPYESQAGSLVLARNGNVRRVIRLNGRIWPLDRLMLQKIRSHLGLPEKAIDRPDEDLGPDPTEEEQLMIQRQAERNERRWKNRSAKV